MARPSKLTDSQWAEIKARLLEGETARSLGREYGLSETAIRKKFGANQSISLQSLQVRNVAEKLADANSALIGLPVSQRPAAISLAEKLQSISRHLASAAEFGASTAHRLSGIANGKVQEIDDAAPIDKESLETLKGIAILTRMANDASTIGVNLLSANKEVVKQANEPDQAPAGLSHFYGE